MNIYVGNLSSFTTEKHLEDIFVPFGEVRSVKVVMDALSGRSRRFGFVEMPARDNAERAIKELHNTRLNTQLIVVSEVQPRSTETSRSKK